jgi:hypothetical protein
MKIGQVTGTLEGYPSIAPSNRDITSFTSPSDAANEVVRDLMEKSKKSHWQGGLHIRLVLNIEGLD